MAIGREVTCGYDKCQVRFVKKTHNQRYHSNECCVNATKEKAMAKYYESKARKSGKERVCSSAKCCVKLSRYNPSKFCEKCQNKALAETNKKLLQMIS